MTSRRHATFPGPVADRSLTWMCTLPELPAAAATRPVMALGARPPTAYTRLLPTAPSPRRHQHRCRHPRRYCHCSAGRPRPPDASTLAACRRHPARVLHAPGLRFRHHWASRPATLPPHHPGGCEGRARLARPSASHQRRCIRWDGRHPPPPCWKKLLPRQPPPPAARPTLHTRPCIATGQRGRRHRRLPARPTPTASRRQRLPL